MSFEQKRCPRCAELHLTQDDGSMTIHLTKNGERCAPPKPFPPHRRIYDHDFAYIKKVVGGGAPGLGKRA